MVPPRRQSLMLLLTAGLLHVGLLWQVWGTQRARPLAEPSPVIQLSIGGGSKHLTVGMHKPPWHQSPKSHAVSPPQPKIAAKTVATVPRESSGKSAGEASSDLAVVVPKPSSDSTVSRDQLQQTSNLPAKIGESDPSAVESGEVVGTASTDQSPIDLGSAVSQGNLGPYETLLLERIRQHEYYPRTARLRRLQGEVLVLFTVLHDGNLGSVAVKNSSGIAVLDEAALNIIEASAPFPAPTTYGLGLRTYVLPLLFQLK